MKRIIDLKQRLTDLTYRENKIQYYEDGDDCSSDSDMEEVPPSTADDLLAQCLVKEAAGSKRDDDVTISPAPSELFSSLFLQPFRYFF